MLRPSKASMLGLQSPSRLRGICELPQPPQLLHHRAHISPFLRASQHLHNAAASPQPPKALSSSAAASLPPPSLQEDVAVSQALRRSRAAFVCLAAIAAWTYMASSNCPSAPLASVSLAAGETSMQGKRACHQQHAARNKRQASCPFIASASLSILLWPPFCAAWAQRLH